MRLGPQKLLILKHRYCAAFFFSRPRKLRRAFCGSLGIECPTKLKMTKHQGLMCGTALRLSKHCRRSVPAEMYRVCAALLWRSCSGSRRVQVRLGPWSRPKLKGNLRACQVGGEMEAEVQRYCSTCWKFSPQKTLESKAFKPDLSEKVEVWLDCSKTKRLKLFCFLQHLHWQDGARACCCVPDLYTH